MAKEASLPAFETVNEARAALEEGKRKLHEAADKFEAGSTGRKQLDFCAGCLIDLRESLSQAVDETGIRIGVNHGCSR